VETTSIIRSGRFAKRRIDGSKRLQKRDNQRATPVNVTSVSIPMHHELHESLQDAILTRVPARRGAERKSFSFPRFFIFTAVERRKHGETGKVATKRDTGSIPHGRRRGGPLQERLGGHNIVPRLLGADKEWPAVGRSCICLNLPLEHTVNFTQVEVVFIFLQRP
jgi:hypothetical protein